MKKLKISIKKIAKLYKSGLSATQIGEQLEVSHNTAWRRLKEARIKPKNGGYYSGGQFKKGNIPWSKGIDNRVTKICKTCKKKFKVYPYRKNNAEFCSYKCLGENRKGKKLSKETRKKISEHLYKYPRKAFLGKKLSEEHKEKIRLGCLGKNKGKKRTPESREKMRKVALKRCKDKNYLKKMSKRMKKLWQNKEYREKQIKASLKGLLKRPTSLEQQMINLIKKHNLPYKYVGNGSFLIGWKNPDFININGEKKLIEVGNVYHHQGNYIEKRTNHFAKYGWKSYIFIMDKLDEKEVLKNLRPETQSGYG